MATFMPRNFANAERLRTVQPTFLMALLEKHAAYFDARGVDFGKFNGGGPDYDAIAGVLMSPDSATPSALIDDLYYVDEMATQTGMDALLEAANAAKLELDLDDEPSPADVAVQVRLRAPELLEKKHAEQFLLERRRTFVYFQSKDDVDTTYRAPNAKKVRAFEDALGARLDAMKRGRTCKLFAFKRDGGISFLVRRGDQYKREGAIEKTKTTSVYYRPEKYDVLRYDETLGELAINAEGNKKIAEHYRALVGVLLFDDDQRFPGTAKFTLDPLREAGAASLVCSDVEGIDSVVLKEVQLMRGGSFGLVEILRAKDLLAAYAEKGRELPKGRITKASFLVKFSGQKAPRTVTIRPNNIASYTRNEDTVPVEAWMARRGFIKTSIPETHDDADLGQASSWV